MIDSDMEDGASESCADPGEPPNLKYVFMDINNISSRYTEVCPVSCSAKSIVFSALDHHGERLAVKKVVLSILIVSFKYLHLSVCDLNCN